MPIAAPIRIAPIPGTIGELPLVVSSRITAPTGSNRLPPRSVRLRPKRRKRLAVRMLEIGQPTTRAVSVKPATMVE